MSGLTFVTLAVIAYGVLGRHGYGRALALGGVTVAGSAIVVGGTAVPTFYATAFGAVFVVGVDMLGDGRSATPRRVRLPPGASLLIAFTLWCIFVTLVAPLIFDGLPIVSPTATVLTAGLVTSSNLAQIIYLVLGVCVMIYVARSRSAGPELIALAAGTATLLSLWRYLAQNLGLPFPEGLFDNAPFYAFIETAAGNIERFRGIFSEPSSLAGSSLVTIAYMVPRALQVRGWRRACATTIAAVALYLGIISTSTTFVVAGLAVIFIAAASGSLRFLSRRVSLSRLVSVVGCALVIVGLWVLPIIITFVDTTVNDKLVSTSYSERTSANTDSLKVFLDTFGFGVGIGSARASSFLPTLLSATGLVGSILFSAAVLTLIYRNWGVSAQGPVVWTLLTYLVTRIAAGPDLSDSSGIFWIALGLLSRATLQARERSAGESQHELGRESPGRVGRVSGSRGST